MHELIKKHHRIIILLVGLSGCSPSDPGLHIDLETCQAGNNSFTTVLKKNQQGRFTAQAYELMATAPLHGVYFGVCGADVQHGQSMLVNLPRQQDPQFPLSITPSLVRGMSKNAVEALFGLPNISHNGEPYKEILLSGNKYGSHGRWAGLCSGFTMQFSFDENARLTRLLILPMDETDPT